MTNSASKHLAARVERLVRSLVGISDVRLAWTSRGTLHAVHLVRHPDTQQHQLVRNVVSGLKAAFGIELPTSAIQMHADASTLPPAAPLEVPIAEPEPVAAVVDAPKVAAYAPVKIASAVGAAVPASTEKAPVVVAERLPPADAMRRHEHPRHIAMMTEPIVARPVEAQLRVPREPVELDHIDVERHGRTLRCRIVLSVGENTYPAMAEAADGPSAEAELAARVALDALRAAGAVGASFHGIGMITISNCNYLVATVRDSADGVARAGAVPLLDSMAWSAALAVLRAAGTETPVDMRPAAGPAMRTATYA
jgi:hypothetical protein